MLGYYRLNGRTPEACTMEEWAAATEDVYRRRASSDVDPWRVAETPLYDAVWVSTVFLALDHNHTCCSHHCSCPGGIHVPILFETMVFGVGDEDGYQERTVNWDAALAAHDRAVAWARQQVEARLGPPD